MMNKLTHFWIRPLLLVAVTILALAVTPYLAGVKPVWLWTDILLFLLLAMLVLLIAYMRTRPHLLRPWQRVFRRRLAMISLVILLFYIIAGVLDSLHFRQPLPGSAENQVVHYSVEVHSVLDILLSDIRTHVEKTYSAPFATHLYAKESITLEDGRQIRDFPRLQHGGAHLKEPHSDRAGDIAYKTLKGIFIGLFLSAVSIFLLLALMARRDATAMKSCWLSIWQQQRAVPWRAILLTFTLMVTLLSVLLLLGGYYHVFGTDKVGQDVLYLAIKSIRTGLIIGTLTTLVMLPFAIMLGIMAGYFRGWIDDAIQYLYTTLNSIPGILLIAAAVLSIQVYISNHPELFQTATDRADLRLLALCFILGITSWTGLCRLLRGESLKLREMDYIQAANAFGVSHFTIITRHILPNVMHIVLILVVLDFSALVLAEAVLAYVGIGVDPATLSWGNMINGARLELAREPLVWWSLVAAFIFMFMLVLAANLFADAVRDAFDPRINEER